MVDRPAIGRRVGGANAAACVDDDAGAVLGIGPRRPHRRGCCVGRRRSSPRWKPIRPGLTIWPRIETWKSVRNIERLISEKYGKIISEMYRKIGYAQDGKQISKD